MWNVTVISGAAGGSTREATVNLTVETLSDTVEEVRKRVERLPALEEAARWVFQDALDRGETHDDQGDWHDDWKALRDALDPRP